MTVNNLYLPRLSNKLHVWFHRRIIAEITIKGAEAYDIEASEFNAYKTQIDAEVDLLDRTRASAYTKQVKASDDQRNAYFRNLHTALTNMRYSPDAGKISAYETIAPVLNEFPLSTLYIGSRERTTSYESFLNKIKSKLSTQLETLDLQTAFESLETANNAFGQWSTFRADEWDEAVTGEVLSSRATSDTIYADLVHLIEHLASRSDEEVVKANCTQLISRCNMWVADARRRMKIIATYNAKRRAGEEVDEKELQDALEGTSSGADSEQNADTQAAV